ARVLAADTEIAGLVRGSWPDFRERERLVAAESAALQAIAEAQRYRHAPTDSQRATVESVAADLAAAAQRVPPALRDGLLRLEAQLRALLAAAPAEQALFDRIAFLTAGPRVDALSAALGRELEARLGERELYRTYLVAYSGALLVLIAYLVARVVASYRLLHLANE